MPDVGSADTIHCPGLKSHPLLNLPPNVQFHMQAGAQDPLTATPLVRFQE